MASIIFQKRLANIQAMKNAGEKTETSTQLTFGEKNKMAWELVKSGEAKNLKEAWEILRENGSHK